MGKPHLKTTFHPNTFMENENILQKLRAPSKIHNKSVSEWNKLFTKLNTPRESKASKSLKCVGQLHSAGQNNLGKKSIYGPIPGFPSGSWWGIRMDCSRDQVHTPFDSSIEEGNFGVTSICTSNVNTTDDVDLGTLLTYTGGEYLPGQSHKLNDPLLNNFKNHVPLRLVRSYNLANEFAPKTGYRYDGLYIVASFWIGVCSNSKKYYKYALARLNCQESPVWSMPTRVSTRLSSTMKKTSSKSSCRLLKHRIDDCQMQRPETTPKKINMERLQNTNIIKSMQNNINSKIFDSQNNSKESSIVMRHVSKKYEAASPIQPLNTLAYAAKPPTSDLQNMNISIRTELYDSSPNPQEDLKKLVPMTFYKVQRTDNKIITKNMIHSNTPDAINLSVFGPNNDNLIQESQIQMRKPNNKSSPIFNTNSKDQELMNNNLTLDGDKEMVKIDSPIDDKQISDNIDINNRTNMDLNLDSENKDIGLSLSTNQSINKQSNLPEAFVELESMTPEQMLNLIMKKRFNPTGKLLMGSIIGLPVNDSCLVNINGSLKIIENKNDDNKINSFLNKSQRMKMSDETKKKTARGNNKKFYESTPKPKSPIKVEQKTKNEKIRKNSDPLSKSTVMKKRNSELAKLTINANFMTNLRSIQTRTMSGRRLRCPKILLNKKKEFPGFVTNFARVDLTKKSKRSRIKKKSHVLTKIRKNLKNSNALKEIIKSDSKIPKTQNNQINCNRHNENSDKNITKNLELKQNNLFETSNKVDKSVGDSVEMKDASTQFSSRKDASTSVNMEKQLFYRRNSLVKVEWIDLVDDVKTELNESDRSLSTIFYRDRQVQTSEEVEYAHTDMINKQMYNTTYVSDENSYIKYNSNECGSAFVPVNLSDKDLRVVKLRSIGFKPIESYDITDNSAYADYYTTTNVEHEIVTREVNEQYNKYISEENNIVEYMDNELHYEDIEAEEIIEDDEYEEQEQEELEEEEEEEDEEIDEEVEIEVEIEDEKGKILPHSSMSDIFYNSEYVKKRKHSFSSIEDENEIELENNIEDGEENLPWLGWNRFVNTTR